MECATIFGHSVIARMRADLLDGVFGNRQEFDTDLEMSSYLADKLRITSCFTHVKTLSTVRTIEKLPEHFHTNDKLLVVDFGSNDLANMHTATKSGVRMLVEHMFRWASTRGAQKVLILGVLPRSKHPKCDNIIFEDNRRWYNRFMQKLCKNSDICDFRKIRGYERYPGGYKKSVRAWSKDGIHPYDMKRYANLLSHCMMLASLPK